MGRGIHCLTGNRALLSTNLLFGLGSLFQSLHQKLQAAEAENKITVLGTGIKRIKIPGLRKQHCYALLSYNADNRTAILSDPYGPGATIPEQSARVEVGSAAFQFTLDEINQSFMGMAIEK